MLHVMYYVLCMSYLFYGIVGTLYVLQFCGYVSEMSGPYNIPSADTTGEAPSGKSWKGQRQWSFQSKRLWGGHCLLLQVRLLKQLTYYRKQFTFLKWFILCYVMLLWIKVCFFLFFWPFITEAFPLYQLWLHSTTEPRQRSTSSTGTVLWETARGYWSWSQAILKVLSFYAQWHFYGVKMHVNKNTVIMLASFYLKKQLLLWWPFLNFLYVLIVASMYVMCCMWFIFFHHQPFYAVPLFIITRATSKWLLKIWGSYWRKSRRMLQPL